MNKKNKKMAEKERAHFKTKLLTYFTYIKNNRLHVPRGDWSTRGGRTQLGVPIGLHPRPSKRLVQSPLRVDSVVVFAYLRVS